jgi:opacity protein-like surface antigen
VSRLIPIMMICVVILAVLSTPSSAQNKERGRMWYLKGSFGMAGQDLGELEKAFKDEKQDWVDEGIDLSTYSRDFDTVWDYRIETGAVIFKHFTLGAAFNYQPRGDDQDISGVSPQDQIRIAEEIKINYYAILAVLQYRFPGKHSFFIGANGGWGNGSFEQNTTATATLNPDWNMTASGKYDGSNFVYGFSAGYQYEFVNGALVYLEMGYERRDLGTFSGTTTSTNTDIVPESSGNYNVDGEDINFDYSGPFLAVGFGFTGPY